MNQKLSLELRYWDYGGVVWSKGQHTPEEFCDAAGRVFEGMEIPPGSVHQTYARLYGAFEDGEYQGQVLDYPVEQKRGAFLITYTEEFYCGEEVFDKYGVFCGD